MILSTLGFWMSKFSFHYQESSKAKPAASAEVGVHLTQFSVKESWGKGLLLKLLTGLRNKVLHYTHEQSGIAMILF